MFVFFLLFINLSIAIEYPKYLYVKFLNEGDTCYDDGPIDEATRDELKQECYKFNPPILGGVDACNAAADSHLGNKCILLKDGDTLDDLLSQIDPSVELLLIESKVVSPEMTINFNSLPKKMSVCFSPRLLPSDTTLSLITAMAKTKYDGKPKSMINLMKELTKNKKSIKEYEYGTLHIVGNIKEKVSSLFIKNVKFDIVDYDLDIDDFIIEEGEILTTSPKKILVNNFLASMLFHQGQVLDYAALKTIIQPKSFMAYDGTSFLETTPIEFRFSNDYLTITQDEMDVDIPYDMANTLGMVTCPESITFSSDSDFSVPDDFLLNLTLKMYYPYAGPDGYILFSETAYPETFPIKLNKGDWTGTTKPRVLLINNNDYINIDKADVEDILTFVTDGDKPTDEEKPTDEYKPTDEEKTTDSGDIPDDGDNTGSIKVEQIESITISDKDKAGNEISDAFNDENRKWSQDKDNVVAIDENTKELSLNMQMKENQFILPTSGTTIDLVDGNLNLIIPSDGTVTVKTSSEKSISIKGGGTLKIEPKESSLTNINLDSKSQINSSFTIEVPSDSSIESVTIDSITLYKPKENIQVKAMKSNSPIVLNINNLESNKESSSSLTNANIIKSLSIEQPSSLTLNNVGLKDADVSVNLDLNPKEPSILGDIKEVPKSFIITGVNGNLQEEVEYPLIRASFDCNEWLSKLSLDQTVFNDKKCKEYEKGNAVMLAEKAEELVVSKSKEKKNKLSTGAIIGIVVGCVAFVAIVVVVVVVIVKRKRTKVTNSSSLN